MGPTPVVKVVYGCCVGSWERLQRNVVPRIGDRPLVAISGQTSIAIAYNAILDTANDIDADALILVHDDLELIDPHGEDKLLGALHGSVALAGIAGGMCRSGIAWWNESPIGHQQTDARYIDFGPHSGYVDLLEGSLLAFSRRGLASLRFDTQYRGFHGYDVDISRQAREYGMDVVVADVDTYHHTQMGFKSAESHQNWLAADQRFRAKWGLL